MKKRKLILPLGSLATVITASTSALAMNINEHENVLITKLKNLFINKTALSKTLAGNEQIYALELSNSASFKEFVEWASQLNEIDRKNSDLVINKISTLNITEGQKFFVLYLYIQNLDSWRNGILKEQTFNLKRMADPDRFSIPNCSAVVQGSVVDVYDKRNFGCFTANSLTGISISNHNANSFLLKDDADVVNINNHFSVPNANNDKNNDYDEYLKAIITDLNIQKFPSIKVIYTSAEGYQLINIDPSVAITFNVVDSNKQPKQNKFLVNGDFIAINEAGSTNYYPIQNLTTFIFIPPALTNPSKDFDASKFVEDQYASYKITTISKDGVSTSTIESTSKIPGYKVLPLFSKIAYVTNNTTKIVDGLLSLANGHSNTAVGFDSSWSDPKYDTAWSEVRTQLYKAAKPGQSTDAINGWFDVNNIKIFANFTDSGANPFLYQQREVKSYTINVYDAGNKVVKTIDVPNATNLKTTIYNNLSGSAADIVANAFEFAFSAATVVIPGLGEVGIAANVGKALAELGIGLALQYGAPAAINAVVGAIAGQPNLALTTFGYTPRNVSSGLLMSSQIINTLGSAASLGYGAFKMTAAEKINEFGEKLAKTFGLQGQQLFLILKGAGLSGNAFDFISNIAALTNQNTATNSPVVVSKFSAGSPEIASFWEKFNQALSSNTGQLAFNKYAVTIPTPGLQIPYGGHLDIKATYVNNVGSTFHTTLFHWWSHSWGRFETSDPVQFEFNGVEHTIAIDETNTPKATNNQSTQTQQLQQ